MTEQTADRAPTRERILDAAVELFGRQGYHGTSVGEIESAAGLVPRAGALYKHFSSKAALLEAAMQRRTHAVQQFEQIIDASMTGAPFELALLARSALHEIGEDQPVMRIVVKEGENFPGLRDEFRERIVRRGHLKTVQWLELASSRARVKGLDLDAIAAVMLGSLINYRILETLFGRPPGDVDEERFIEAWVDSTHKMLEAYGLTADATTQEAVA